MDTLGNCYFIAQELFARLGNGGAEIIDVRANAHLLEGDAEAARFWKRVASVMRELGLSRTRCINVGRRASGDPAQTGDETGAAPVVAERRLVLH